MVEAEMDAYGGGDSSWDALPASSAGIVKVVVPPTAGGVKLAIDKLNKFGKRGSVPCCRVKNWGLDGFEALRFPAVGELEPEL